jgi:hypothetical protein
MRRFALFVSCLATAALPAVMFVNDLAGPMSVAAGKAVSPAEASQLFGGSCCGDKFSATFQCAGLSMGCTSGSCNANRGACGSYNQGSDDSPCGNYECSVNGDFNGNEHLYSGQTSCSK